MNPQNKKQASRANDWIPPLSAFEQTGCKMIKGDHPAMLSDEALLKDVIFDLLPQVYRKAYNPGENVIQIEFKVEKHIHRGQ